MKSSNLSLSLTLTITAAEQLVFITKFVAVDGQTSRLILTVHDKIL